MKPTQEPRPDELNDSVETVSADAFDPLIEAFKRDVDRTLLRENLKLTPQQRSEKFLTVVSAVYEMRGKARPELKVWR